MEEKENQRQNNIRDLTPAGDSSSDFTLDDLNSLESTIKNLETDMSAIKGSAPKKKKVEEEIESYFVGDVIDSNLTKEIIQDKLIDIDLSFYPVMPGQLLYADSSKKEKKYKAGSYTFLTEGGRIFSKREGIYAVDDENKINVSPLKRTKGSIKRSSQTHHIKESLVVNGKIEDGASIEVDGDLIVMGSVGDAHIKTGGNLFVRGGITGQDAKTKITALCVFAKYIDSACVEAYESVFVKEDILNSKIYAGGAVYLLGNKSSVSGGEIIAGAEVNCKFLGNDKNTDTTVFAALKTEADKKISDYDGRIKKLEQALQETNSTAEKKNYIEKEMRFLDSQIGKLKNADALKKDAKVCVEKTVYPGVKLAVGDSDIYSVKRQQNKAAFMEKKGKVVSDVYTDPRIKGITKKARAVNETDKIDASKLRTNIVVASKSEGFAHIASSRFLGIPKTSLILVKLSRDETSETGIYRAVMIKQGEDIEKIKKFYEPKDILTNIRITCDTVEEGFKKAAIRLNADKEQMDHKIIQQKSKGVMGIGAKPYIIDFSLKAFKEEKKPEKKRSKEGLAALTKDSDGYFVITNDDDGLKLSVYPAKGEGAPVDYNEIKKYLEEKKFKKQVDYKLIADAAERADARARPDIIGPRQPQPELDGAFNVDIEDGKTKCYVEAKKARPGGKEITFEDVYNSLVEKGVKDIKEDKLKQIFDKGLYGKRIVVAEGVAPVIGQDAYYEFKVRVDKSEMKTKRDDEEKVDFHELDKIENVTKGQVLAVKHPATDGKSGMDVFGNEIISNKGKDTTIIAGKNTEIDDDGVTIKSTLDGQVLLMGKLLKVEPIYTVAKDVDYETGNINFLGSVMVRGAVRDGFSVRATGDIYVNNVEKAFLEAEGNIYIKSGMQGHDEGEIHAGGDITAKFLENAKAYAGRNIIVQEAILHSEINAGSVVQVKTGKRGWVVGSHVRAKDGIDVKELGSKVGTKTTVEAGLDPMMRKKAKDLEDELKNNVESFQKIKGALKKLIELKKETGALPEKKEELLQQLVTAGKNMDKRVKEIDAELKSIEEELSETTNAVVSIFGKAWPGVKITIKNANLFIDKDLQHLSFIYEAGEIAQKMYKELKLKKTGDEEKK